MNLGDLLEKYSLNIKLPQHMLEYTVRDFEEHHTEKSDNGNQLHVFSTKNSQGDLLEGVLDPKEVAYYDYTTFKDQDHRVGNGGVNSEGVFI